MVHLVDLARAHEGKELLEQHGIALSILGVLMLSTL